MMDGDIILVIIIVAIMTFGAIVISTIALIARAISRRGAGRKELQELRQDILQIKNLVNDIREQIADVIIRLG